MLNMEKLKIEYTKMWWETSSIMPNLGKEYSLSMQRTREHEMDYIVGRLLHEIRKKPEAIEKDNAWGQRVKSLLCMAGDGILELSGGGMKKLLEGGYLKVTSDFIIKAREDNAAISTSDIMQAMRNAWIMNCIQVFFGREVLFTPALYAYSMLYPYTDNYLDSKAVSLDEKNGFGKRFRLKLDGKMAEPGNSHETRVFKLVDMIESQYSRKDHAQVYESLLGIHDAQQGSLMQHATTLQPYDTDILGISIQKGGSSVLADGFLVNGSMSEEQASFIFGFGVFLQFIDDAQDVSTDRKNSHITIFSQTAGKWKLDNLIARLSSFICNLLDNDKCFTQPDMLGQKDLIKSACSLLLFVAVANNSKLYSREFVKNLEKQSPLSFGYLKKLYRRAGREYARTFLEDNQKHHIDTVIARALI